MTLANDVIIIMNGRSIVTINIYSLMIINSLMLCLSLRWQFLAKTQLAIVTAKVQLNGSKENKFKPGSQEAAIYPRSHSSNSIQAFKHHSIQFCSILALRQMRFLAIF